MDFDSEGQADRFCDFVVLSFPKVGPMGCGRWAMSTIPTSLVHPNFWRFRLRGLWKQTCGGSRKVWNEQKTTIDIYDASPKKKKRHFLPLEKPLGKTCKMLWVCGLVWSGGFQGSDLGI